MQTPRSTSGAGSTTFCWICGRSVSLEAGKTDEHGNLVHEDCYVELVRLKKEQSQLGVDERRKSA